MKELENEFCHTLQKFDLVRPGRKVLIALSGGADSLFLALIFLKTAARLGITLHAAHLNHCLRGAESDGDEAFVRAWCQRHGLELAVGRSDARQYSEQNGLSLEEGARELRYRFFEQTARETGADTVATAHHQDDAAETVLYRLLKGSGPGGLGGIAPQRGIYIRPLLWLGAEKIRAAMTAAGETWREDSSNRDDQPARNYLRNTVAPLLQARFPSWARKAGECAELLRREDEFWADYLKPHLDSLILAEDNLIFDLSAAAALLPAARARLFYLLCRRSFGDAFQTRQEWVETALQQWEKTRGSSRVFCAGGVSVNREYHRFVFIRGVENFPKEPKYVKLTDAAVLYADTFSVKVSDCQLPYGGGCMFAVPPAEGVWLRAVLPGDRLEYQAGHHKKVQDMLVDAKVPARLRKHALVVAGSGQAGMVMALICPGGFFRVAAPHYCGRFETGYTLTIQERRND